VHELASRRLEPGGKTVDELARLAADGDEAAFDALVRQCYRRIYRWALVRVGEPDDAEDITQEVLVRLYRHLSSWEGRGRFATWLYGVTRNAAASHTVRSRGQDRRRDIDRATRAVGGVENEILGRMHAEGVVEMIDLLLVELPARQRELFDLIDVQGFTPVEVAEMLDMNPSTVRVHLFRARRRLRGWILEHDPDLRTGSG
jgi:RNA polymerase sigma-70 factor (ECF subfamily)